MNSADARPTETGPDRPDAPLPGDIRRSDSAPLVPRAHRRTLWTLPALSLALGLIVSLILAGLSHNVYERNQRHLLSLRIRDAQSLLTAAIPRLQTTLASAAELADATGGNVARFRMFLAPDVGTKQGQEFSDASLWSLRDPDRGPLTTLGLTPRLLAGPPARTFIERVAHSETLSVTGFLSGPDPRLGYGYATPGDPTGYAVYAESPLPANRRSPISNTSAFAGLDYALFLGPSTSPRRLLLTNVAHLPLPGRTARIDVPFGDTTLGFEMSTTHSLSGTLPRDLPWIILLGGLVLALAAATGALRLTERRRHAEELALELDQIARENRRLYAEQRSIAQTLQHALLPDRLPVIPGVEASARYQAGEASVDIGGDWYDVLEMGGGQLLLVVGDVSGRGLRAATTMAALRYAIHAYSTQNDPPETILGKLSKLLSVSADGQLATVLCVLVDVTTRELAVTSAGHLPPLVLGGGNGGGGRARFLRGPVGLPIGVDPAATYTTTLHHVPEGATLLAYTDGLVERRGEDLEAGLARLATAAEDAEGELGELLSNLVKTLTEGHSRDDIAIVGVKWTS